MKARYTTSIKGKIIAALAVSLAALISSYFINQYAFREIHNSVKDLAFTHRKLAMVNKVFSEANEMEKLFRNKVTADPSRDPLNIQSPEFRNYADSLKILCADNPYQTALIDSLTQLFDTREKLLSEYVDFRQKIRKNNPVLKQAATLDSLISDETSQVDSQVYSGEAMNRTTRSDTVAVSTPAPKKNLWRKLFKNQAKESSEISHIQQKVVETKTDTIVIQISQNNVKEEAQKIIDDIGKEQSLRRKNFLNKEIALNQFENSFHTKITDLLSEIEQDITRQTELMQYTAEDNIHTGMRQVFVIIACFFCFAIVMTLLMLTDITKSNKYRRLLEEARKDAEQRSLSWKRFLSNMSHEIRTPLQSIIGYTEQLKPLAGSETGPVKVIGDSSRHLLEVINEILDYNKIISGSFSFEKKPFNITEVIAGVNAMLQPQADQKGILLLSDIEKLPQNDFLIGDAFRLKQILLNLAGNAIKFTDQGKVTIHTERRQDSDNEITYAFTISDTGPGIPYDMQETIFHQFEQARLPAALQYKGTGLGLSIVKALVEGQGGSISLESHPGAGAHFSFQLRFEKATASAVPEKESALFVAPAHPVWLVDDDQLILQLCTIIFKKHQISYQVFSNASAMLEASHTQTPSLILMDIRMPDMNGFLLFEELKKRHFFSNIPLVALTAQALPSEQQEMLRHGFDGILLKPFREEDILSLIQLHAGNFSETALPATDSDYDKMTESKETESILRHYIQETTSDVALLQSALAANHIDDTIMLLHRIAGRTAQIGERDLAGIFRKAEIMIQREGVMDHAEIQTAIAKIRAFLQKSDTEIV